MKLPNETSYKDRIEFHRFSAVVWASLANDARGMLAKETFSTTRVQLEGFIERALDRAFNHYRQADVIRRRGHA